MINSNKTSKHRRQRRKTTTAITSAMALVACGMAASSTPVAADTVELNNGDVLTGTIQSLDAGLVTLRSPLAQAPLEIKSEAIRKMSFPGQSEDTPVHQERLTLANGDVVPCKVLSMDKQQLHISTWFAGPFSIPRTNIRSLQFGISKEQTVFAANHPPAQWDTHDGRWSHAGTVYSATGTGTLAQKLELPENVKFSFNLSWKDTPNFAFRFCAENDAPMTKQDCYELLVNSAGMQIRRYENARQPAAPLANISKLKPRSFAKQSVNIEIRVDRSLGLVTLFIDQKKIDSWPDPFQTTKGNYVVFNNRSSAKSGCTISNFAVTGLSAGSSPRHREKETRVSTDILVASDGDKLSGTLIAISEGATNHRTITLNKEHSTAPTNVPGRRVSALFFASPASDLEFKKSTFTAILYGGGQLQLENPRLVNGKLSSIHPILGPCSLTPKAVSHITQVQAKE